MTCPSGNIADIDESFITTDKGWPSPTNMKVSPLLMKGHHHHWCRWKFHQRQWKFIIAKTDENFISGSKMSSSPTTTQMKEKSDHHQWRWKFHLRQWKVFFINEDESFIFAHGRSSSLTQILVNEESPKPMMEVAENPPSRKQSSESIRSLR